MDKECGKSMRIKEALLDSSLISQTNKKLYNIKLIDCNNYIQLYCYDRTRSKQDNNWCKIGDEKNRGEVENNDALSGVTNKPLDTEYNEIRIDMLYVVNYL